MVVVATDIRHWSAGFSRLVNAASGGISCVGSEMELFLSDEGIWLIVQIKSLFYAIESRHRFVNNSQ